MPCRVRRSHGYTGRVCGRMRGVGSRGGRNNAMPLQTPPGKTNNARDPLDPIYLVKALPPSFLLISESWSSLDPSGRNQPRQFQNFSLWCGDPFACSRYDSSSGMFGLPKTGFLGILGLFSERPGRWIGAWTFEGMAKDLWWCSVSRNWGNVNCDSRWENVST